MRVLCVSIDLPGHLDWGGYLGAAGELAGRGHDIVWASGEAVAQAVGQANGVRFQPLARTGWQHGMPPLPGDLDPPARELARRQRALDVWLNPASVLAALAELESLAADLRPDVILAEPFAAAGVLLAEKLGLPLVIVGRPALPPIDQPGPATAAISELCQAAGVAGDYWDVARGMPRSPHLHIDFFTRTWYADLPDVAPQTRFCGGLPFPPRPIVDVFKWRQPFIFITLGSTFTDDETFFRLAAESVVMVGCQSMIAVGRNVPHILRSLNDAPPARCHVAEWINFRGLFPHLRAIIHHGGVATTHAALLHGIPQIVVPHAGDQYPQAARVSGWGRLRHPPARFQLD